MPITRDNAAAHGRAGGLATLTRYGVEHYRRLGAKGFAALARRKGYMGGSRLGALQFLLSKGRMADRGPDPSPAIEWAERVPDEFNINDPEVPL
jgi:hypothetical protein